MLRLCLLLESGYRILPFHWCASWSSPVCLVSKHPTAPPGYLLATVGALYDGRLNFRLNVLKHICWQTGASWEENTSRYGKIEKNPWNWERKRSTFSCNHKNFYIASHFQSGLFSFQHCWTRVSSKFERLSGFLTCRYFVLCTEK